MKNNWRQDNSPLKPNGGLLFFLRVAVIRRIVYEMLYLDNNATTMMPPEVIEVMTRWFNKGNPSANYKAAKVCRAMIDEFKAYLAQWCGISLKEYEVIFTSCASETNCFIIRASVDAYWALIGDMPHVVASSIEHKSILLCLEELAKGGRCEYSLADPGPTGHVDASAVGPLLRDNTCLATVMGANNETGAINDVAAIGALCHRHDVPFYSDMVQYFGKYRFNGGALDAFGVSFHKIHGPPGMGALIVRRAFIEGYKLGPMICGTQNGGLRGGTENVPALAASYAALRFMGGLHGANREAKNRKIWAIKRDIMAGLAAKWPTMTYLEYLRKGGPPGISIVLVGGANEGYLCGTLLFSVVKTEAPLMCNVKLKEALERNGAIVSIGSACNTASDKASHVLDRLGADKYIRKGTLRVSIGDLNGPNDGKKFVEIFDQSLVEVLKVL